MIPQLANNPRAANRGRPSGWRWAVIGIVLGLLLVLLVPAVLADARDDDVRDAIAAGDVAPLQDVLTRAQAAFGGRVLKAELTRTRGRGPRRWQYEIKLLTDDGAVLKLEYDAGTLELIEAKGRRGADEDDDDDEDGRDDD